MMLPRLVHHHGIVRRVSSHLRRCGRATGGGGVVVARRNERRSVHGGVDARTRANVGRRRRGSTVRTLATETNQSNAWSSSSLDGRALDRPECNVTRSVAAKVGRNLHRSPHHPLRAIKTRIETYWKARDPAFVVFDDLSPIVSAEANFDSLRIEPDHPSRSRSDTYYLDDDTVLRTHTSAHQVDLLRKGTDTFLVTGDVYRRDEIDSSHYPVFHQTEGVRIISDDEFSSNGAVTHQDRLKYAEDDLKQGLEGMVIDLFGDVETKWSEDYFPFTQPSFELEILFEREWLEVLGCGVVHPRILANAGRPPSTVGWAFGLGLERLAMVLFSVPDIRLFWTDDERFHAQFRDADDARTVTFRPYSKYPPCRKDVSFWILDDDNDDDATRKRFHANELTEIVRDVAGDLVEKVELVDEFEHPRTGRTSHCYRLSYRSMDRSLTNEEIDGLQEIVRSRVADELRVELR